MLVNLNWNIALTIKKQSQFSLRVENFTGLNCLIKGGKNQMAQILSLISWFER